MENQLRISEALSECITDFMRISKCAHSFHMGPKRQMPNVANASGHMGMYVLTGTSY